MRLRISRPEPFGIREVAVRRARRTKEGASTASGNALSNMSEVWSTVKASLIAFRTNVFCFISLMLLPDMRRSVSAGQSRSTEGVCDTWLLLEAVPASAY